MATRTKNPTIDASSKGASTMAELMASSLGKQFTPIQKGDTVKGTIKKLTPQEILLDIGAKGDALVIEFDKQNLENLLSLLHVGDSVQASIISAESEEGFPVVSLRKLLDTLIFGKYEDFYKKNESISGRVAEVTRGGYFIDGPFGIRGFLPNSQITEEKLNSGAFLDVKIIELDAQKKRVIFSQKAIFYTTDIASITKYVARGDTIEVEITHVIPYGIYAIFSAAKDIIIEGFIHISEVSHDRIENLETLFSKGQKVKAQVLDIDQENRRVNLSLRALQKDAFAEVKNTYKKEQKVKGTIAEVKSRGVTVTLAPHITGFIPGDKVPTDTAYTVGASIEAEVTDFDDKRRVILLSPILKKTFVGYR